MKRFLSKLRDSPRAVALAALAVLLIYLCWMAGPYLRSIVARDAAITGWISAAYAPIPGRITDAISVGMPVGADGRIATIVNDRADPSPLVHAEAARAEAVARRDGLVAHVAMLESILADRTRAADAFAEAFRRNLADEIAAARASVEFLQSTLARERTEADRQERMMSQGASSQTEADLARVRAIDRERQLSDALAMLARAERRLEAMESGAFLIFDESDVGDARRAVDETAIVLEAARTELAAADALLSIREDAVSSATAQLMLEREAAIEVPAGAIVWSLAAGSGTEVIAGAKIASWVDCSRLLVDVPVSDLEASLLKPGASAEVAIEGETEIRMGQVLFTRGAAATLTEIDLAAVAKGRDSGVGQAIVEIAAFTTDANTCPIGRAAFVDFPGVGVIDMIAARLRL